MKEDPDQISARAIFWYPTNSPSANNAISIIGALEEENKIEPADASARRDAWALLTVDKDIGYYAASLADESHPLPEKYRVLGRETFKSAVAAIQNERQLELQAKGRLTGVQISAEIRAWLPWIVAICATAYAYFTGSAPSLAV